MVVRAHVGATWVLQIIPTLKKGSEHILSYCYVLKMKETQNDERHYLGLTSIVTVTGFSGLTGKLKWQRFMIALFLKLGVKST